jgi:hypothetical protein
LRAVDGRQFHGRRSSIRRIGGRRTRVEHVVEIAKEFDVVKLGGGDE